MVYKGTKAKERKMKNLYLVFLVVLFVRCRPDVMNENRLYFLEIGDQGCDSVIHQLKDGEDYYLLGCAEKGVLNGRYLEYFGLGDTVLGFCSYQYSYRKSIGFSNKQDYYLELVRFSEGRLSFPEFLQYQNDTLLSNSSFFNISITKDSIFLEPIGYNQDSLLVHWRDSLLLATTDRRVSLSSDILEDLVRIEPLELRLITFKDNGIDFVARLHQLNYQRIKFSKELLNVPDSMRKSIVDSRRIGPVARELILSKRRN